MPRPQNLLAAVGPAAAFTPAVHWARNFVDSVGVNTHMLHADSFYGAHFDLMKQKLLSARISHIRDGAMDQRGGFSSGDQAARFSELGKAGIHVEFLSRLSMSREFIQGFPARVSPAFEAWELPNELNAQPIPWVTTLRSWMPLFAQYIRSPAQTVYPIIGPSLVDLGNNPYRQLGNQADHIDFGNIHKYYRNFNPGTSGYGGAGNAPCSAVRYGSLSYSTCNEAAISGTKPVIITESGYGTDAVAGKAVTPQVQAKYISRLLLLHMAAGIRRTYIYQLADYGTDGFGAFGLLTQDGTEKPAFRELSNLLNEMYDQASVGHPTKPTFSIGGETRDVVCTVFEKSDGSYRLVAWLEKPSYDTRADKVIAVPGQQVTLTALTGYRVRRLLTFDDSGDVTTQPQSSSGTAFTVQVHDNLTILDVARSKTPNSPTDSHISR
jgi:hypothetical protein